MTIHCPCCGQSVNADRLSVNALVDAPMERRMRDLLDALVKVYPRSVSISYLTDALYAADPNGGPDNPGNSIRVYISRLRKILPQYGWTIPSNRSGFGAHSRYRLEPLK